MYEIPISQGRLRPGYVLARESAENLDILGVEYDAGDRFLPDLATLWVKVSLTDMLSGAGVSYMDPARILTHHLSFILKKYSEDFLGIQETQFLLAHMEQQAPELVKEVQRILPVQKITEVFKRLVSEEISIRNLRTILHALIEWGQKEKDVVVLTEYVRISSKRYISYKYCGGRNVLPAYLLTPEVEDEVRNSIRQTSAGSYLALDPNKSRKLVENVKKAVGDIANHAHRPVLLTSMDVRRYVRKLLEADLYLLPVLSYQELTQEITVQPLSRITI
jgi:type III secretion protein V